MFHQPLIVAVPPWYRRSLRGWNPWGWRSLMLDPLPDEPVVTAVGYYRPDDPGGGAFYWDADCEKTTDGGAVIDPDLTEDDSCDT